MGEHQRFKKHLAELLGGVDVEFPARVGVDAIREVRDYRVKGFAVAHKSIALDGEALLLHFKKDRGKGHFYIVKEIFEVIFRNFLLQYFIYIKNQRGCGCALVSDRAEI